MPARLVAVLMLLGCASDRQPAETGDAADASASSLAPAPATRESDGPCGRTQTVTLDGGAFSYTVPCRPYDRMRDLADPAP